LKKVWGGQGGGIRSYVMVDKEGKKEKLRILGTEEKEHL